jgi:hypothetical protein
MLFHITNKPKTYVSPTYRRRELQGECLRCGSKDRVQGKTQCQPCLEICKKKAAEHSAKRRAEGKCPHCGSGQVHEGNTMCPDCLRKSRDVYKVKQTQVAIEHGHCHRCCQPHPGKTKCCQKCLAEAKLANRRGLKT